MFSVSVNAVHFALDIRKISTISPQFQQIFCVTNRFVAVGNADFLVQIADVGFDGGGCHLQFIRDLFVAVTGIN